MQGDVRISYLRDFDVINEEDEKKHDEREKCLYISFRLHWLYLPAKRNPASVLERMGNVGRGNIVVWSHDR